MALVRLILHRLTWANSRGASYPRVRNAPVSAFLSKGRCGLTGKRSGGLRRPEELVMQLSLNQMSDKLSELSRQRAASSKPSKGPVRMLTTHHAQSYEQVAKEVTGR